MGSIMSAIEDEMVEYERRCEKYGEKVVYTTGGPDCYGTHALQLKDRERAEHEAKRNSTMGHYDECRPGYCSCGAGPGNIKNGICQFCGPKKTAAPVKSTGHHLDPDAQLASPGKRKGTPSQWSDEDEKAFQEATARRQRHRDAKRAVLQKYADDLHSCLPREIVDYLVENAEPIRAALKPFDKSIKASD